MENKKSKIEDKKTKASMTLSLGEKRIENFRKKCDEMELTYSNVIQNLIDDWIKKNK